MACAALLSAYAGYRHEDAQAAASARAQAQAEAALAPQAQPLEDSIVPIVVYHVVRPALQSDSAAVKKLAVLPEVFDEQLAYLTQQHYTVIPFSQVEDHLLRGAALPPHPIVITFDDGWRDQYEYAFPILLKYGMRATFFIPSNFPDHPSFMSWEELANLQAAGMSIGDHSMSHPDFSKHLSSTTLWREIVESKRVLEEHLGIFVREFAYPFGYITPEAVETVKSAGFVAARADTPPKDQTAAGIYALGAYNAPTTMSLFKHYFPPNN